MEPGELGAGGALGGGRRSLACAARTALLELPRTPARRPSQEALSRAPCFSDHACRRSPGSQGPGPGSRELELLPRLLILMRLNGNIRCVGWGGVAAGSRKEEEGSEEGGGGAEPRRAAPRRDGGEAGGRRGGGLPAGGRVG